MVELQTEQEEVRDFLRGTEMRPGRVQPLVKALKEQRSGFYWARRLLTVVLEGDQDRSPMPELQSDPWYWQQLAMALYKDDGLPRQEAFELALDILDRRLHLADTTDPETLGIAGGLHKRWWQYSQRVPQLRRARELYERGHRVPGNDGYCGINAAYVTDLLAAIDGHAERDERSEADQLRAEVIDLVLPLVGPGQPQRAHYFMWATLGEAYFCLSRFDDAAEAFRHARTETGPARWELETTARQMGELVRLKGFDEPGVWPDAHRALDELIDDPEALRSMLAGRMGLALSGGGFRAALFHIGVLARLAETDQLRHIEVISCVSGGSIIGAYYYLELQHLLESKRDVDIGRQDYVELVQRVIEHFVAGVQSDIRNQVYASPVANLRLLRRGWNGTRRLGHLYETCLFSHVVDDRGGSDRVLDQLLCRPRGEPEDFDPLRANAWRRNKVPALYLNTTCLNTGHGWQFTASWMGEPPTAIDSDIDANERFRRLYSGQVPKSVNPVRLGEAVAASSAVPGLFPPLLLEGLYDDRTVSLVDGGAQDNQGVSTLLDNDCQLVVVSDGSGQMASLNAPPIDPLRVSLRSASSVQHSLRGAYHADVTSRTSNGMLRRSAWVHLKKDLESVDVNWIGMPEPLSRVGLGNTTYGIDRKIQRAVADLRTDLDAFTDIEAKALMLSGYRMTRQALAGWAVQPLADDPPPDWWFEDIAPIVSVAPDASAEGKRVLRHLTVGGRVFGKVTRYHPWVRVVSRLLTVLAAVVLLLPFVLWTSTAATVLGWLVLALLGLVVLGVVGQRFPPLGWLSRGIKAVGMGAIGWIPGTFYLHIGRPLQLAAGRLHPRSP